MENKKVTQVCLPNDLMLGCMPHSHLALMCLGIGACQIGKRKVPRAEVIELIPSMRSKARRTQVIKELLENKVLFNNGMELLVFSSIVDDRGSLEFVLTDEADSLMGPTVAWLCTMLQAE